MANRAGQRRTVLADWALLMAWSRQRSRNHAQMESCCGRGDIPDRMTGEALAGLSCHVCRRLPWDYPKLRGYWDLGTLREGGAVALRERIPGGLKTREGATG